MGPDSEIFVSKKNVVLAINAIAVTIGAWSAATRAQPAATYTDQQAIAGQTAYAQSCAACHGKNAEFSVDKSHAR